MFENVTEPIAKAAFSAFWTPKSYFGEDLDESKQECVRFRDTTWIFKKHGDDSIQLKLLKDLLAPLQMLRPLYLPFYFLCLNLSHLFYHGLELIVNGLHYALKITLRQVNVAAFGLDMDTAAIVTPSTVHDVCEWKLLQRFLPGKTRPDGTIKQSSLYLTLRDTICVIPVQLLDFLLVAASQIYALVVSFLFGFKAGPGHKWPPTTGVDWEVPKDRSKGSAAFCHMVETRVTQVVDTPFRLIMTYAFGVGKVKKCADSEKSCVKDIDCWSTAEKAQLAQLSPAQQKSKVGGLEICGPYNKCKKQDSPCDSDTEKCEENICKAKEGAIDGEVHLAGLLPWFLLRVPCVLTMNAVKIYTDQLANLLGFILDEILLFVDSKGRVFQAVSKLVMSPLSFIFDGVEVLLKAIFGEFSDMLGSIVGNAHTGGGCDGVDFGFGLGLGKALCEDVNIVLDAVLLYQKFFIVHGFATKIYRDPPGFAKSLFDCNSKKGPPEIGPFGLPIPFSFGPVKALGLRKKKIRKHYCALMATKLSPKLSGASVTRLSAKGAKESVLLDESPAMLQRDEFASQPQRRRRPAQPLDWLGRSNRGGVDETPTKHLRSPLSVTGRHLLHAKGRSAGQSTSESSDEHGGSTTRTHLCAQRVLRCNENIYKQANASHCATEFVLVDCRTSSTAKEPTSNLGTGADSMSFTTADDCREVEFELADLGDMIIDIVLKMKGGISLFKGYKLGHGWILNKACELQAEIAKLTSNFKFQMRVCNPESLHPYGWLRALKNGWPLQQASIGAGGVKASIHFNTVGVKMANLLKNMVHNFETKSRKASCLLKSVINAFVKFTISATLKRKSNGGWEFSVNLDTVRDVLRRIFPFTILEAAFKSGTNVVMPSDGAGAVGNDLTGGLDPDASEADIAAALAGATSNPAKATDGSDSFLETKPAAAVAIDAAETAVDSAKEAISHSPSQVAFLELDYAGEAGKAVGSAATAAAKSTAKAAEKAAGAVSKGLASFFSDTKDEPAPRAELPEAEIFRPVFHMPSDEAACKKLTEIVGPLSTGARVYGTWEATAGGKCSMSSSQDGKTALTKDEKKEVDAAVDDHKSVAPFPLWSQIIAYSVSPAGLGGKATARVCTVLGICTKARPHAGGAIGWLLSRGVTDRWTPGARKYKCLPPTQGAEDFIKKVTADPTTEKDKYQESKWTHGAFFKTIDFVTDRVAQLFDLGANGMHGGKKPKCEAAQEFNF